MAFVDLAGYTAMTDTHGDEDAATLAERFATLAHESPEIGGRLASQAA